MLPVMMMPATLHKYGRRKREGRLVEEEEFTTENNIMEVAKPNGTVRVHPISCSTFSPCNLPTPHTAMRPVFYSFDKND